MKGWTATLLLVSGFGSVWASTQRWLPACAPGRLQSAACSRVQDHVFDFTAPSPPWRPVGHAAEIEGVALLVLAVAAVTLVPLLLGVRRSLSAWLVGTAVGAGFAAVGSQTLLSGLRGAVADVPGTLAGAVVVLLAWPSVLLVLLLAQHRSGRPSAGWRAAAALLLLAGSPFGAHLVASATVPVTAYDAIPWTEAIAGVATMLAGLALLPVRPPRWKPSLVAASQWAPDGQRVSL
jgi:hypothetical protein